MELNMKIRIMCDTCDSLMFPEIQLKSHPPKEPRNTYYLCIACGDNCEVYEPDFEMRKNPFARNEPDQSVLDPRGTPQWVLDSMRGVGITVRVN
jgi:hypothetical protein